MTHRLQQTVFLCGIRVDAVVTAFSCHLICILGSISGLSSCVGLTTFEFASIKQFIYRCEGAKISNVEVGVHQMEPLSPLQALGVNPFPSRRFRALIEERGDESREMTVVLSYIK